MLDVTFDRDNYNVDDYDITYASLDKQINIELKLEMTTLNRIEEDFKDR